MLIKLLLFIFSLLQVYGDSNGFKRELIPLESPKNLTLLNFDTNGNAVIEWDPVSPKSVRGNFRGYLIRIWNHEMNRLRTSLPNTTKIAIPFFPFSKNFITVSVRNDKYTGPRSLAISFDAPQTVPDMPELFKYNQLGFHSALLQWNKPIHSNGILLGYNLYCNEYDSSNNGTINDELVTVQEFISGADNTQIKITGLKQDGQKYQIELSAVNCVGEGKKSKIVVELDPHVAHAPSKPSFTYTINYQRVNETDKCNTDILEIVNQTNENTSIISELSTNSMEEFKSSNNEHCYVTTLIKWLPDLTANNPGEYFYVKYRVKGSDIEWTNTSIEYSEDFLLLDRFNACENYEIVLIAIDGDFNTESDLQVTPAVLFPINY